MKEIDDQKRELLKEISLPSNEDFSSINYETNESKKNQRKSVFKFDVDDNSLKDISINLNLFDDLGNYIDTVFEEKQVQKKHIPDEDSLDVIQEQLFEDTAQSALRQSSQGKYSFGIKV